MGEVTGIEWTDRTWSPHYGCTKVSPGCANCYMYREFRRYGKDPATVQRAAAGTFYAPLIWQKKLEKTGERKLVFTCSLGDFFDRHADAWRQEEWSIMARCQNLIFQVLTKRPNRAEAWYKANGWLPNVWLGTSVESQKFASRLDTLARIPAPVRFVSAEPLLGPLDLRKWLYAASRAARAARTRGPCIPTGRGACATSARRRTCRSSSNNGESGVRITCATRTPN